VQATSVPASEAPELPELPADSLLEAYRRMTLIRVFEERVSELYRNSEVPGFVHLSIGQEASAVGACWPLAVTDVITSNHRGHGHCLAKGLAPEPMMAELLARSTGTNRGLGGSMHIADPDLGIFGANGIVAAGVPIAGGAALAAKLRRLRSRADGAGGAGVAGRTGEGGDGGAGSAGGAGEEAESGVVVSFFGDGAVAQGAFHEAANLAALWRLPIVFFCENNGYAEFSPIADQHPVPMSARAAGYGLDYVPVDGNDVEAVAAVMTDAVRRIRAGGGPVFVEASTYRWHGHYEGDPEKYRSADELSDWRRRDPLVITRARLLGRGVGQEILDAVEAEVRARIDAAVDAARQAPPPDMSVLRSSVYAPRPAIAEPDWVPAPDGEIFRTMDAVRLALEGALDANPEAFIAGVDVGKGGNVFALTRGLHARWPDRLLDTPISETAVMGLAVGGAMAGMTPLVELMYLDFLGVCFDQILNQAAKLRFMTGGKARMGLVIRTQFGGGRSSGSQHSQSLEALLAHVPGLTVVMPSTPADTYGLLRSAILDPNPVVFIENRQQYGMKGPKPPADYLIPLGQAKVVREGTDLTIVSVSRMVHEALAAAEALAPRGISVEVIDLRTVAPLDKKTILASLAKTNRLLIAHEGVTDFGIGAEIAALAAYQGFWTLDAPVMRVAPPPTPSPYAPSLEEQWLPDRRAIERAAEELIRV
jgi:2-oxoisovalerate dehydrogenase E1 component